MAWHDELAWERDVRCCSKTTPKGFEPLRAEPNGFLVHHLNHSVTVSLMVMPNMMTITIITIELCRSVDRKVPVRCLFGIRSVSDRCPFGVHSVSVR